MRTLTDLLVAIFPDGTRFPAVAGLESKDEQPARPATYPAPFWPPDAFAYAAKLLDLSGAYHHVTPDTLPPSAHQVRQLKVTSAERQLATDVGSKWRKSLRSARVTSVPHAPLEVRKLWARLRDAGKEPLFAPTPLSSPAPGFWRDALLLLMMADEASLEIGFDPDTRQVDQSPPSLFEALLDLFRYNSPKLFHEDRHDSFHSCSFANGNVVGVMPKSRTPAVGCTLRCLSHNLALLPPVGEVRVRWLSPHEVDAASPDRPLKLLVVPFPFRVDQACFRSSGTAITSQAAPSWGWFEIDQPWLGEPAVTEDRARAFAAFVLDLIEQAGSDGVPVNAIVLPEAALNEAFFATLFDALLASCPQVETVVSGTSQTFSDKKGVGLRRGNFVAQGVFIDSGGKRKGIRTIREKHHRWRLDASQIDIYGLADQLSPDRLWWERIDITSRSLDVVAFRPDATMTTLICEDLARVDPCQGAVRAVGPTLLVALLMDGSQLAFRWPARYATILAEDPGCSVLTVASLGLIRRSRLPDGSRPKWSIGLWRDDRAGPVELILKPDHHAVAVTVDPSWTTECGLDGREDGNRALAWRLRTEGGGAPRSIRAGKPVPRWITG